MKRIIAITVCIIMLLSVSPVSKADLGESLSFSDISAMSNYMNGGQFVKSGNWIYGLDYYGGKAALSMRSASDLSRSKYISKGIIPSYLFIDGSWLYYVAEDLYHNNSTSIRRVKISGEGETVIVSEDDIPSGNPISSLFYHDGHIYFSTYNELYRANLDGSDIKDMISYTRIHRPYYVCDRLYYYVTVGLHVTLYSSDLKGRNAKLLASAGDLFSDDSKIPNSIVTDGNVIYFETTDGDVNRINSDGSIAPLRIKTGGNGFAYDGYLIYYADPSDEFRLYSYNPVTEEINFVSDDTNTEFINILFEGMLAYLDFNKDFSLVDHVYVVGYDGSVKFEMK